MRRVILSALLMSSGFAVHASTHHSDGEGKSHLNDRAHVHGEHAFHFKNKKPCSEFLAAWRPQHPHACPPSISWSEVQPGLSLGVSSWEYDRKSRVMASDVTIQNNTGRTIPAGSKLLIRDTSVAPKNATGISEQGDYYIALSEDVVSGEQAVVRAEFKARLRPLNFSADIEVLDVSNGVLAITGEPRVVRTLTASVNDADGISSSVSYQWYADGLQIEGATQDYFTLVDENEGAVFSVSASYIDARGIEESLQSEVPSPIAARRVNSEGVVVLQGERVVGGTLRAVLADNNGISEQASYEWFVDGELITGASESILQLDGSLTGKQISVVARYTDYDAYEESPATESSRIATRVARSGVELADVVAGAAPGDWIALASGDYSNMPELEITDGVVLTLGSESTAVITGATCINLSGNNTGLFGLTFDQLSPLLGSACDDNNKLSNVWVSGDNVTLSENSFLGHVDVLGSVAEYNWVYLRGSYNTIERNLFSGKSLDIKGAAVSVYNKSNGSEGGHIVQYNLFKDMPGTSVQSSAYALQVGRSTGSDSSGEGLHVVRYNRFDNVLADRRIIKVQASRSTIYGNTIIHSTGGISLEDGYENTVANNIILSSGVNSDDSGIMFAPFGHTIKSNYVSGLRTTSSQRAALLLTTEPVANSGNSALEISPVLVQNNTLLNNNRAIATYSGSKCLEEVFVGYFEGNLVANGVADLPSNGSNHSAFINSCVIDGVQSRFADEYYYAQSSDTVPVVGGVGEAVLDRSGNGLYEDASQSAGVALSDLVLLSSEQVGPGSKYTVAPAGESLTEIDIDFAHWYITFPSGEAEYNPQWLLDGNTVDDVFYFDGDGAAVFKTPNIGGTTSENTKYSRTELREMMRGPEQSPKPADWPSTQGVNKNNWVFSNSYQRTQYDAGGVDGVMEATLKVDHVSTTFDEGYEYMVGRVIVGQIHASKDEPFRLYYRKLPGNELGSVYFATEVPGIGDTRYTMIGDSEQDSPNPVDGIALGEVWSYRVEAKADDLTVTIMRAGKPDITRTVKTAPVYANDWMYFKAGVYNQNNGGAMDDFAQATFYSIKVSHDAPPEDPGNGEDEGGDGGTTQVVDGASLQAAILNSAYGETVALGDGDYANVGTVVVTDGITLTRAEGSSAVISGEFCLQVSGDDARVTGLMFEHLILPSDSANHCRSNGDGNIVITGDNVVFDHNLLAGDAEFPTPVDDDYHNWLVVKGSDALIERNTFQHRRGIAADGVSQVRGGFISLFVNGSVTGATVQYNFFKDMLLESQSTAYAIQLGRTYGLDSLDDGSHTIQYNRFDNMDSKTRIIRVQGSSNSINNNTVVNSQGMIALESGQSNVVSYNVILPSGLDSNDGGISAAPYGHRIYGNYIAGSKTTSSERGALYLNNDVDEEGNLSVLPSSVEVFDNTIINAKQPIHIGSKGCEVGPAFLANFHNNLIANGVENWGPGFEGIPVTGRAAIRYSCALDSASSFTGEAYYTDHLYNTAGTLLEGIVFDASSEFGFDGEVEFNQSYYGLLEPRGALLGKGASGDSLIIMDEADVGVGSTTAF